MTSEAEEGEKGAAAGTLILSMFCMFPPLLQQAFGAGRGLRVEVFLIRGPLVKFRQPIRYVFPGRGESWSQPPQLATRVQQLLRREAYQASPPPHPMAEARQNCPSSMEPNWAEAEAKGCTTQTKTLMKESLEEEAWEN